MVTRTVTRRSRIAARAARWIGLANALALAGCDACVEPTADAPTCEGPGGVRLQVGATVLAADGCNECLCSTSLELRCSTGPCDGPGPEDAGTQDDAGPEPEPGDDAGVSDAGTDVEPDPGPCADTDGDGFHPCVDPAFPDRPTELDCDDGRFHVQPGGYEFPDTTEDDNCNGSATDWSLCDCAASATTGLDSTAAMDLCGDTVSNATRSGAALQFGVVEEYQGAIDAQLRAVSPVASEPPILLSNGCMATLSTGDAVGVGGSDRGGCTVGGHSQSMNCGSCNGGSFPPSPDDPVVCDIARLDLVLDVPANVSGFAFDFMFMSYEWPEFLCQQYNDTFLANVRTAAVNGGDETNAAFDPDGRPITVNVGFFENPPDWTVSLDATSFGNDDPFQISCSAPSVEQCTLPAYCEDGLIDGRNGSGSGWLTTSVPVQPGEQGMRLTLRIHDEGDNDYDSVALIDNFRWLPFAPPLQTGKGGGF